MVALAMTAAREEILARVRRALADVPGDERPEDVTVARAYRMREPEGSVERFIERVTDYGAGVRTVGAADVAAAVGEACRESGVGALALPVDMPPAWVPPSVEGVADLDLDAAELDRIGAALTGCLLAIADTGTIVFDGGARQGRRALTLVPDVHVCVVEETQVLDGVPAAMRRIAAELRAARRPVTFVSGPSATSDIEFSRVEGVHGPRRLELVVVRA
ncbi:MAG TPA: LUD domain-containing protein [Gaiellaceae bacterium]|nr:LUD domain-containing protein [Gaiellaceae bacterium]